MFEDRARGRWVAQLDHEGQRYRRVRPTQAAALDALDDLRARVRKGLDPGQQPTVEAFLRDWLASRRVRPTTLRGYRSKLEQHVIPAIGKIRLDRLRPSTLERLFLELERTKGLSPRSASHVRAVLRNALARAERYGLVERNAAALTEAVQVPNRERQVLTMDEARQLAAALRGHRLEACFAIAMTLGLRQSEALALRWADVDLTAAGVAQPGSAAVGTSRGTLRQDGGSNPSTGLHVRQTLHRAGGEYVLAPPKTPRSRRDVPLTDLIASLLAARRTQQRAEYLATGARPTHDLVFTTRAGGYLMGTNVTRELQRVLAAAGLPTITFHDLRHIAASNLAARGFTLREVQAILGHASITTTSNVYVHPDESDIATRMRGISW